jgi:hypothetical protein
MWFVTNASGKWLRLLPRNTAYVLLVFAVVFGSCCTSFSQDEENDNPRGNVHLGTTLTGGLNPTARFSNFGWGLTAGGGYNFTRRHAVVGEFMWDHLFMSGNAVSVIRLAAQDPTIDGRGELFALTGNYRYELRGKALGTYLIAGGGLYHRTASLSRRVTTGKNITCEPTWLWWGYSCSSGLVTAGQTIIGSSSTALGLNGGIGFTVRVSDAPYRVYVESRYHYAPMKHVNAQVIAVTVGIRY